MVEKIKNLLLGINIPLIAFISYVIKVLITSPSFPETIVMAIIAGVFSYKMKIDPFVKQLSKPNEKVLQDIQELKNALGRINMAELSKPKKRF